MVPRPSSPKVFEPQHWTWDVVSTAQAWLNALTALSDWPADTSVAGPRVLTLTGVIEPWVVPLPSWPVALLPQHQIVWSGIRVHEPPPPDDTTGGVPALAGPVAAVPARLRQAATRPSTMAAARSRLELR